MQKADRELCKGFHSCPVISSMFMFPFKVEARGVYSQGPRASERVMNGQVGRYVQTEAQQIIGIGSNGQ
jgi:hypothetical protein